jgi:hypothetical protein
MIVIWHCFLKIYLLKELYLLLIRNNDDLQLRGSKFIALDVPTQNHLTLEDRLAIVNQLSANAFLDVSHGISIQNEEQLDSLLLMDIPLILRQSKSFYGDETSFISIVVSLS